MELRVPMPSHRMTGMAWSSLRDESALGVYKGTYQPERRVEGIPDRVESTCKATRSQSPVTFQGALRRVV